MKRRKKDEFFMCRRKNKYTARKAHQSAEKLHRKFGSDAGVYRCPFCGSFHIGRDRQKLKKGEDKNV